jgi:hypothetical protein
MNPSFINNYLQRAQEIIGDRTEAEMRYDDAVVSHLSSGASIQKAIQEANKDYPEEALKPQADRWEDVRLHYEYIMEHKNILKKLGMKET